MEAQTKSRALVAGPALTWTFIGPQPMLGEGANFDGVLLGGPIANVTGRITALAVDPRTPGLVFVGAATGGVWMSADGGASFVSIGDNLPTQAIGAIALDAVNTNPTTVYVGTGEDNSSGDSLYGMGIYKTADLGATWDRVDDGLFDDLSISALAVVATDNSSGQKPPPALNPPALVATVGFGESSSRGYATVLTSAGQFGAQQNTGVWFSTDGGESWTRQEGCLTVTTFAGGLICSVCRELGSPDSACPADDVVVDPYNVSNVYVSVHGDDVYFTHSFFNFGFQPAQFPTTLAAARYGAPLFSGTGPGFFPADVNQVGRVTLAIGPPEGVGAGNCPAHRYDYATTNYDCGAVYAMVGAPNNAPNLGEEYIGFFKSTDGGESWQSLQVPQVTLLPPAPSGQPPLPPVILDGTDPAPTNHSQAFYDQALAALSNPGSLLFGGVGIYLSNDSGNSWSAQISGGGVHADQHAIAPDPFATGRAYVGNDGGLYSLDIASGIYTPLNATLGVGQIQGIGPHPSDSNRMLAGFQDNATQLYAGSAGWNVVLESGDTGFALFDQVNPSFAYEASPGDPMKFPFLARSGDGGMTWDTSPTNAIQAAGLLPNTSAFYPPLAVDPAVSQRVFFGAHTVFVSTDGMLTWQQQTQQDLTGKCGDGTCACKDGTCALVDLEFAPSDDTHAVALAAAGGAVSFRVYVTDEANCPDQPTCPVPTPVPPALPGALWVNVTGNLPIETAATQATGIAIDPHNFRILYLSLSGFTAATGVPGHIYKSRDFGATWARADGGLPDVPVLRVLVEKLDTTGQTLYAGTDIGVFQSTDGGGSWIPFNQGVIPNVPVFDLEENNVGVIFAGTHGRGAFKLGNPILTPTSTTSVTLTPTSTPTPTASVTPTPSSTPTPTDTPTPTPVPTPTDTPNGAATPATVTPVPEATPTSTSTPEPVNDVTITLSGIPDATPGETLTLGCATGANYDSVDETLNSVTIGIGDPMLFSCVQLTVTIAGSPHSVSICPPTSAEAVFNFSPALDIPPNTQATLCLDVTISMNPI